MYSTENLFCVFMRYDVWKRQKQPSEVFFGKGVLKIFSKFTRENPCRSALSIRLRSLRHGCSSVNSLHIFRSPFSGNTSGGLFLKRDDKIPWWKISRNIVNVSYVTSYFNFQRKIMKPCFLMKTHINISQHWSFTNYIEITLDAQLSKISLLKRYFSISIILSNEIFESNKTTAKVPTSRSPYCSEALKRK